MYFTNCSGIQKGCIFVSVSVWNPLTAFHRDSQQVGMLAVSILRQAQYKCRTVASLHLREKALRALRLGVSKKPLREINFA